MIYKQLKKINTKPQLYSKYTAKDLWVDEHRSQQMLNFHLNQEVDISSNSNVYIEQVVRFMVDRFQLDYNHHIIDFGCGPGLYTNRLAKYTNVTGIDFSKNSIDYAIQSSQEIGVNVEYILGDYLSINLDQKYDLISLIMYDFCALSREQRQVLLLKFKQVLKKGGKIIFDVLSDHSYNNKSEESFYQHLQLNGFWSNKDYYAFVNTFRYDEEKVILDKYTIIEESKEYEIYNWMKYYSLDELHIELEENGFAIDSHYSDMTGKEYNKTSNTIAIIGHLK